jgi:hypothetical protein
LPGLMLGDFADQSGLALVFESVAFAIDGGDVGMLSRPIEQSNSKRFVREDP